MLGFAARHSFAPKAKRTGFNLPAHEVNNSRLIEPKIELYRFEWGSVFPGHLNNSG
jgi:hypothetical protein